MNERAEHAAQGGQLLDRYLKRRGWSSPAFAAQIGSVVSASSIRAYQTGETLPTPATALAVARAFPRDEGVALLEAWGYFEAAEAYDEAPPDTPSATFTHADDSILPLLDYSLGDRISGTVVGRTKLLGEGLRFIVRLDSGSVIEMQAVESIEVAGDRLDRLRGDAT